MGSYRAKGWLTQNLKDARGDLSQAEAAAALTERFRAAGILGSTEVVLPQSVQSWENDRAAPTGARLVITLRWMKDRLGKEPPGGIPPMPKRKAKAVPAPSPAPQVTRGAQFRGPR